MQVTDWDVLINPVKRAAMQEAIDLAWQSTDPDTVAFQLQLFPEGKPDVPTFVRRMKQHALREILCR